MGIQVFELIEFYGRRLFWKCNDFNGLESCNKCITFVTRTDMGFSTYHLSRFLLFQIGSGLIANMKPYDAG